MCSWLYSVQLSLECAVGYIVCRKGTGTARTEKCAVDYSAQLVSVQKRTAQKREGHTKGHREKMTQRSKRETVPERGGEPTGDAPAPAP